MGENKEMVVQADDQKYGMILIIYASIMTVKQGICYMRQHKNCYMEDKICPSDCEK